MTGTVFIVTIYNTFNGQEVTALMNEADFRELIDSGVDIAYKKYPAETVTAAEVKERINLK